MAEEKYEEDDKLVEIDGAEYYEHFRFVADKGQELLRVDKVHDVERNVLCHDFKLVARAVHHHLNGVERPTSAGSSSTRPPSAST